MHVPEPVPEALYLTRLHLNFRSRDVRADLANSQALHRRLLDAFPHTSREANGLLFRVDPVGQSGANGMTLLAQSTTEPNWDRLPHGYIVASDDYGIDLSGNAAVKEISAIYGLIRAGNLFLFRLRASPTKRVPWGVFKEAYPNRTARQEARHPGRDPRKFDGPRVPVTDYSIEKLVWERDHPGETYQHPESADTMLHSWIASKGRSHGFLVADLVIRPDPLTGDMQRGNKMGDHGEKRNVSHKAIAYDGVLKVTDTVAFQAALRNGIGSGKAYGFGLLSIRRLRGAP